MLKDLTFDNVLDDNKGAIQLVNKISSTVNSSVVTKISRLDQDRSAFSAENDRKAVSVACMNLITNISNHFNPGIAQGVKDINLNLKYLRNRFAVLVK